MNSHFKYLRVSFAVAVFLLLTSPLVLLADEFRPALLELNERDGGWVDLTWKLPMRGNRVLALAPVLPEFLQQIGPGSARQVPGAWLETRSYRSGQQTLNGVTLGVEGLDAIPADVLLRVKLRDGTEHSAILRSGTSSFTIPEQATRMNLAISYWRMGTIHILEGYDHLLFLLTLLLIVSGIWPLLKTVTAFTLAHSLTLALATLGLLYIPPVPTQLTLSERYPWLIAFTFGLVHGLGFAGALSEIGVPRGEVPLALLMFNLGVETGQVMFVVAVSLLLAGLYRLHSHSALGLARATPYAIGGVAMFWTIQRIVLFLPL